MEGSPSLCKQHLPVYNREVAQSRAYGQAALRTTSPSRLSLDTSPSRGGLGNPVQFVRLTAAASHTTKPKRGGTPEAPLLGELAKPLGFD